LQYVQWREFLSNDACTYTVLKEHLIESFSEKMPAHYHYTKLQDATQEKGKLWKSLRIGVDACVKRLLRLGL
jgi:hypothetical protein